MLSKPYLVLVFGAVAFSGACATGRSFNGDSAESESVKITDGDIEKSKIGNENEVTIFDSDLNRGETGKNGKIISKKREDGALEGYDSSTVSTMFDSVGNKTQSRMFKNHSRLSLVVVRTSVDGSYQAYIYGTNGTVKRFTDKPSVDLLKATGDELANMAKIYESREQRDRRKAEEAQDREQQVRSAESRRRESAAQTEKPGIPDRQKNGNQQSEEDPENSPGPQ